MSTALGPERMQTVRHATLAAITTGRFDCTLAEIAKQTGVPYRRLRRRYRRKKFLLDEIVDEVLVDARRSIFNDRSSTGSITATVQRIVAQRLRVYESISNVMPAVLAGRAGTTTFRTLCLTLQSTADYELERCLRGGEDRPSDGTMASIENTLSLSWIDCLRRDDRRSIVEVADLLTAEVISLLGRDRAETSAATERSVAGA